MTLSYHLERAPRYAETVPLYEKKRRPAELQRLRHHPVGPVAIVVHGGGRRVAAGGVAPALEGVAAPRVGYDIAVKVLRFEGREDRRTLRRGAWRTLRHYRTGSRSRGG